MRTNTRMPSTFSAFHEGGCLIQGSLPEVALAASHYLANNKDQQVLIIEDSTCQIVDLDLSGDETLLRRKAEHYPLSTPLPAQASDEPRSAAVTLLPRHWQWLNDQPGSPSGALRRLIDNARHDPQQQAAAAVAYHQQLSYRFCQALCGDFIGYEEARRALYAREQDAFVQQTSRWPEDFALRANALAAPVWADSAIP
ncbi:MAG: DUF2239 family protein [Proteobacteria bacterium]|nr:DUF2239 family protein [Pseudomonadota bacterium]